LQKCRPLVVKKILRLSVTNLHNNLLDCTKGVGGSGYTNVSMYAMTVNLVLNLVVCVCAMIFDYFPLQQAPTISSGLFLFFLYKVLIVELNNIKILIVILPWENSYNTFKLKKISLHLSLVLPTSNVHFKLTYTMMIMMSNNERVWIQAYIRFAPTKKTRRILIRSSLRIWLKERKSVIG